MEDTSIRGRLAGTLEGGSIGLPGGQQLAELRVPRCAQQGRPTHNAPEAVGPGQAPPSRPQVASDLAWFPWTLWRLRSSSGALAVAVAVAVAAATF